MQALEHHLTGFLFLPDGHGQAEKWCKPRPPMKCTGTTRGCIRSTAFSRCKRGSQLVISTGVSGRSCSHASLPAWAALSVAGRKKGPAAEAAVRGMGQGMNQDRLKSVDACTTKTPFGTGDEQVTLRTPRTGSGRWPSLILQVSASETRPTTTTVGAVSTGSVTVSSGGGVQRSLRRLLPRTTQGPSPSAPVAVVFQTPLSGQLTPTAPTATLGIASALVPGGLRSSTPQILSGPTSPSVLPVLSVAAPGHPPARAGAQPVLVVTTAQASTDPQPPQMLVVTHPSGGQPPSSYTVPTYVVSQGGNGFGAGCDGSPVGCFPPVRQLLLERPPRPQVSPPRVTSMPSSISFQGSPTQQPQSTPFRGSPTQQPQSPPSRGSPTQQPQSPPFRGSPTQQPQSPPSRGVLRSSRSRL
ncbi:hypothetical protein TGARI_294970A, partial [Toxoplasma gondii ARI]